MRIQPKPRQSGFTMVELMVGMLIGLIAVVVMFQVFETSEKFRRTTTGAGDAHQNAALSVFMLERDARQAGYGFNYDPLLGCVVRMWHEPSGAQITFPLQPVYITNGTGGAPDQVTFVYGNAGMAQFPGALENAYPTSSGNLVNRFQVTDSRFQFLKGDVVILGEVPANPAAVRKDCTAYQVTDLINPVPGEPGDLVEMRSGGYTDMTGVSRVSMYNPPGGTVPAPYTVNPYPVAKWNKTTRTGGRAVNMGPQPTVVRYSIVNNQLVATDLMDPGTTNVIADNVVQLQVQYGYSANTCSSGNAAETGCSISANALSIAEIIPSTVEAWGDSIREPVGYDAWRRVLAVRLAVVSRSAEADKPDPTIGCSTTNNFPIWRTNKRTPTDQGTPIDVSIGNPLAWKCYRYKITEMTVPIRNLMWFPDHNGFTTN